MDLRNLANTSCRIIEKINGVFFKIGSYVLPLMVFLTVADVLMRYFFNSPITGAFDITESMMIILVAFTLGNCALKKKLVKVDLLYQHFSDRTKAIFDSFTSILSLGLYILITWQTFIYIKLQYETNISSLVLQIPRYPLVAILALGFTVFTVALLANVFENLSKALKR